MKISIVGLGYVGFPLLNALSNHTKHNIIGFDINSKVINKINQGVCPIIDSQTEKIFQSSSHKLQVTTDPEQMNASDVYIICVPTPVDDNFEPNYNPLIEASKIISKYLKTGDIVVVESTISPGTCDEIVSPVMSEISNLKIAQDFDIVHCPERINPGDLKWNITNLPRNIGGSRVSASKKIKKLYQEFIDADLKIVSCLKVAEASKIIENSFRDINIAFVNELAKSFDAMDIDLIETIQAASSKFSFLPHWPGPGVGGHCIAVDPYYLIRRAAKSGFNHRLLKEARNINNSMPDYTVNKLTLLLNDLKLSIKGTNIALLGMSYKPDVGDLRGSPSLVIRDKLLKLGAKLTVYDPFLSEQSTVTSLNDAMNKAEVLVITTAHKKFLQKLSPQYLASHKLKAILDTRNCLESQKIKQLGIRYTGIGRF